MEGFICPTCNEVFEDPTVLSEHFTNMHENQSISSSTKKSITLENMFSRKNTPCKSCLTAPQELQSAESILESIIAENNKITEEMESIKTIHEGVKRDRTKVLNLIKSKMTELESIEKMYQESMSDVQKQIQKGNLSKSDYIENCGKIHEKLERMDMYISELDSKCIIVLDLEAKENQRKIEDANFDAFRMKLFNVISENLSAVKLNLNEFRDLNVRLDEFKKIPAQIKRDFYKELKFIDEKTKNLCDKRNHIKSTVESARITWRTMIETMENLNTKFNKLFEQSLELENETKILTKHRAILVDAKNEMLHIKDQHEDMRLKFENIFEEETSLLKQIERIQAQTREILEKNDSQMAITKVKNQKLRSKSESLRSEINDLSQKLNSLNSQFSSLSNSCENRIQNFKNKIDEISFKNDNIKKSIDVLLEIDLDIQKSKITMLQSQLDEINDKISIISKSNNKLRHKVSSDETKYEALKTEYQEISVQYALNVTRSESIGKDLELEVQKNQDLLIAVARMKNIYWQNKNTATSCSECCAGFKTMSQKLNCSYCGKVFCSKCVFMRMLTNPMKFVIFCSSCALVNSLNK